MAGLNFGAWSETCLISITPKNLTGAGGTEVQFAAMTETVDIDQGDKDIEQIPNLKGGRMVKKVPQDITTITFEGYPIGIDHAGGKGVSQFFNVATGDFDTTEPLVTASSIGRTIFRVCILWTDDTTVTAASGAVTAAKAGYRFSVVNAYMTSMKPSYTDGILKVTFAFKVPAFNKQGTAQIREESTETTTAMVVLSTYDITRFPEDGTTFTW